MAIEPIMADVIRRVIPMLPNKRVLCLGYPDILQIGDPPLDEDRKRVAAWHHWHGGIEHAEHFFASHGLTAEYWDVTQARGPERIVDLNEYRASEFSRFENPINGDMKVGLVVDPGTIEHIANIGNCWQRICEILAIGGYVVHANPLTMANHGFYSIHPTAYADVYEANGFEIVTLAELSGPLDNRTMREAPKTHRFQAAPNAVMLCVAQKRENVAFTWPRQAKYRANPMLKAAQ